jgi:hypothetical protein
LEFLFAARPLELTSPLQCHPWPWGAAAPAQIPACPWGIRPGKGRGRVRGSPRTGLMAWSGWRHCRRWCAAAAAGTSRRASCSGELWPGEKEGAAWGARADAREGEGRVSLACDRLELELAAASGQAAVRAVSRLPLRGDGELGAAEATGSCFKAGRSLAFATKGPSHNCGVRRRGDRRWESAPQRVPARRVACAARGSRLRLGNRRGLTPARPVLAPGGRRPPRRAYGAAGVRQRARRALERGTTSRRDIPSTARLSPLDLNFSQNFATKVH